MTRDQIIELITQVVGDELAVMRSEVERLVALKPLPPFLPPPSWAAGRHSASATVRHCNGLFMARRDTEAEPPHDDWLPLVVGVAEIKVMMDGRLIGIGTRLSDGHSEIVAQKFAVPLFRGLWAADVEYVEGDRVLRNGEWHCTAPTVGIEPGTDGSADLWLKVSGKTRAPGTLAAPTFALSDDGTMTESGRAIGSIKPLVRELLSDLAAKHAK